MRRLLSLIPLMLFGPSALAVETPFVLTHGAFEYEFTRSHLDVVKWRDRFVIGDPHSDPRPTIRPVLLKEGWETLAAPTDEDSQEPMVKQTEDGVTVQLSGTMREVEDGPGRWEWRQTWTLGGDEVLRLDYTLKQLTKPAQNWWLNRVSLIGNRTELFVEYPNKDFHTPGKPIPIITRDGKQVAPLFGEEGSVVDHPAEVRLPFAGHEVIICPDAQARSVELWNGWWRQCINFELPVRERVQAHLEIDLSRLPQIDAPRFVISPVLREPQPWLTADIPAFPPVKRPIRFAQSTPTIIAWGEVRTRSEDELERFFEEMARHFDVMELPVAWTDWKWDLDWSKNAEARKHAQAIAAEVQKQVRIAHKHGIKIALSLNFGDSGPGTGKLETRRQPQFQGETFNPETGEFEKDRDFYDWGNSEAVKCGRKAWEDCARLVGPVDYLFFNEPLWRVLTWYKIPLFSQAALADFRRFVRDPQARFPAKPYAADSPRTDNQAGPEDWMRWYDWVQACFARMIRTQAEAFAAANADNPNYGGAIYFQNVKWTGPRWAVDLDRIAAIPEVTWLCAEYVTDAESPLWRKFKYFAARHNKKLSSFVNIGYYDPDKPGRVRYEGTEEEFQRAVQMGIDENAPMISLFPATSLDSRSPAYNAQRTAIWDQLTRPGG